MDPFSGFYEPIIVDSFALHTLNTYPTLPISPGSCTPYIARTLSWILSLPIYSCRDMFKNAADADLELCSSGIDASTTLITSSTHEHACTGGALPRRHGKAQTAISASFAALPLETTVGKSYCTSRGRDEWGKVSAVPASGPCSALACG